MKQRIEELVEQLNRAARAYYQSDREIMSNQEYDKLYDELADLEKESGIVMSYSPTVKVGYEVLSNLPKEAHPSPMLSLDKTKEVSALEQWLGDKEGLLSWKLDGLTVVLTYEAGQLAKAVTRGDGNIGEVITSNARTFVNIPLSIPEKGQVVIRGEAVISYPDFEMINVDGEYKNPRNLCSGSVRQLNSRITAERNVRFYAFALARGPEFEYRHDQNQWMESQGFQVVDSVKVDRSSVSTEVGKFSEQISDFEIPSDGLVLIYDDIEYGNSLGTTAKFPRDAIAFKWQDELKETELSDVIWNPSRTGLINPIAIFEPVELEGTTVSRASVHNLSQVYELALGIGDKITVYKANMIIPQIAE
ncbi:MAG: NAD-dependent DNA ligase LigA, partial [Bacillota bacterium]|nr:NAD-dependent DNA ligase LigA [Bacillota bacterium]